jgi:uncharacterized protein YdeI (YjbR/CyaY-like superfamily)
MPLEPRNVQFFKNPAALRRWLYEHHASAGELWVGFHKRATGKPSVTWPESVDEALSVGWIDGIRKTLDHETYTIRFTPRRKGSIWSRVNIRRVEVLTTEGRMLPAGIRAFEARLATRSGIYTYEQPARIDHVLDPAYGRAFQQNKTAWTFFEAQPPGYRRLAIRWIMTAKRDETRQSRLRKLIDESAGGRRLF